MATVTNAPKRIKKPKTPRSAKMRCAMDFATSVRNDAIVIREHVKAGFDIPVECYAAIKKAASAIAEIGSTLGSVKYVAPNGLQG